jgi:predicted O-methyltransferase YrrM
MPEPVAHQGFTIELEYALQSAPRYGWGKPAHPLLYELLDRNRDRYREFLHKISRFEPVFRTVPLVPPHGDTLSPFWQNGFIPGLDAAALYAMIALHQPRLYVEIGSGNSTKFAARAIRDLHLATTIVSIDPYPRAEIDQLSHRAIRQPLETADLGIMAKLGAGDILFMDGSHRVFMNSDATVFFLDILPRLNQGVLVQIHDICLPDDYYPDWIGRYYSEQYLLACYLLAATARFRVLLPNHFIWKHPELRPIVQQMWNRVGLAGIEPHGGSFWMEMS